MGKLRKAISRKKDEILIKSQAPKTDELSSQSLQDGFPDEQKVIRTRNGTYRRNIKRRKTAVVKKPVKHTKLATKPSSSDKVSENDVIHLKKNPIEPDNDTDPYTETDPKSDIEEYECIPNGSKSIECFICSCRLSKIYNLRLHMATHLEEDSYNQETFERSEIFNILNPHKRNIDSKTIQKFLIQEIKFKRYSQFYCILNEAAVELHISDSETDSDGAGDLIPRNNYRCDMCKKNFDRRYKVLFHQKTAHTKNDLVVECDYCLKKFVCMNLLIHHLKTQCESDEKPVPCTERFMKFLLKVNLEHYANLAEAREQRKLKRASEGPRSYICEICKKAFTRQEHLNRHSAIHLPEEMKFECPICYRRFNRKDNMRSHMKTHAEKGSRHAESTYILCSYCGRSFSGKSNYVVHIRRHTGEKPYKCNVCGKGFPKSTDLNSHKITHTGEKKFVCTLCDKPFGRAAVLAKHMKHIHSGSYPCTICNKNFLKAKALSLHLRIHGLKRFCPGSSCYEYCSKEVKPSLNFAETGNTNENNEFIENNEIIENNKIIENNEIIEENNEIIEENNEFIENNENNAFNETNQINENKSMIVIREPEEKPTENGPISPIKEKASNVEKNPINDDPLEIFENEWLTTKVKMPVNEIIQNVLQKSKNTVGRDVKQQTSDTYNLMPPFSPIDDDGFDDDDHYDWEYTT